MSDADYQNRYDRVRAAIFTKLYERGINPEVDFVWQGEARVHNVPACDVYTLKLSERSCMHVFIALKEEYFCTLTVEGALSLSALFSTLSSDYAAYSMEQRQHRAVLN